MLLLSEIFSFLYIYTFFFFFFDRDTMLIFILPICERIHSSCLISLLQYLGNIMFVWLQDKLHSQDSLEN